MHFLQPTTYNLQPRRGQTLIVTVLALGATILGATTIAGLLLVYQIRQASDLAQSGRALYAADTGIEWGLYQNYRPEDAAARSAPGDSRRVLTNGASYTAPRCFATGSNEVPCTDPTVTEVIQANGMAGNASRSLEWQLPKREEL